MLVPSIGLNLTLPHIPFSVIIQPPWLLRVSFSLCYRVSQLLDMCSVPPFHTQGRLEQELKIFPKYRKYWNLIKKKDDQMNEEMAERWMIQMYFCVLDLNQFFPSVGNASIIFETSRQILIWSCHCLWSLLGISCDNKRFCTICLASENAFHDTEKLYISSRALGLPLMGPLLVVLTCRITES